MNISVQAKREEAIEAGYRALRPRFPASYSIEDFTKALESWDVQAFCLGDEVVGMLMTRGNELHVAVLPEVRGKWLSRRLIREVISPLMQKYGEAKTEVMPDNGIGRDFVKRLGFSGNDIAVLREGFNNLVFDPVSAVIGGGAAILGSVISSNAAEDAASQQANAANNATQTQLGMFNTINAQQAPWRQAGANALDDISAMKPQFTLTINAGTWTIRSNWTATRAIGAAAAGTSNSQKWDVTFTGDAGGTTNVRATYFTSTSSGGNAIATSTALRADLTHAGSATLTTGQAFSAVGIVSSTGNVTSLAGANIALQLTSSGAVTTGDAYKAAAPSLTSTGAFTTLNGFHANDLGHATLVTTANGFLCDDLTPSATAVNGFKSAVTAAAGKLSFNDSGGAGIQGAGKIVSIGATQGIGYATGAGGTQTQGAGSGKATALTLNTITGAITMNNAALGSRAIVTFTVACTAVLAATDTAIVHHESGGTVGAYTFRVGNFVAGTSFDITVTNNSAGSLSEALVLRYAIIRSVNA